MATLSYETAKKLKDAGFPQTKGTGEWYTLGGRYAYGVRPVKESTAETVSIPTLSELIEACGADLFQLVNSTNYPCPVKWQAYRPGNDTPHFGPTPEEAVANLYCELKK